MIGKGTYGVVSSEYDTHLRKKVAIKKINDLFEHASDVIRILREIKLLWLLRHRDIVEIWHILLPLSRREFMDIYVIFEFMESDLHQVTEANDDQMPKHYRFFLYQLLRGLKYIHIGYMLARRLCFNYLDFPQQRIYFIYLGIYIAILAAMVYSNP